MKCTLDFIVIGAQKSGTTSLFEHLRHHPQLELPVRKEAPYFSHDKRWERAWGTYIAEEFGSADPSCRWGTVTPSYMVGGVYEVGREVASDPYDERTVPRRIQERLPDARLIAILRDPVERAESHYKMLLLKGLETRTFDEAIASLLTQEALTDSRRHPKELSGYVAWGEYGRILSAYLDVFSREQLLVLFTHELKAAPEQLLRRVCAFLDVAYVPGPASVTTHYREGSTARRFGWLNTARMQEAAARSKWSRAIWHATPTGARRWTDRRYEQISYQLDLWNRRRTVSDISVAASTVTRLREHFEEDAEKLERLTGSTPPWTTPDKCQEIR